mgnify:CR=1 FL=1
MRDFKKYEIWQLSHAFTLRIYSSTSLFPKDEMYGITSQIRRASSSIPTNISEGCGRNSDKEFNQFLNIALGSASETEYLIILSRDLNYIDTEKFALATVAHEITHILDSGIKGGPSVFGNLDPTQSLKKDEVFNKSRLYLSDIREIVARVYGNTSYMIELLHKRIDEMRTSEIIKKADEQRRWNPEDLYRTSFYLIDEEAHPCLFDVELENPQDMPCDE